MPRPTATADVFAAIAEPRRRRIVELLAGRGATAVGAIVLAVGLPQPAVSKHLAVLHRAGVVSVTREGRQRLYRLEAEQLKRVHEWAGRFERLWSRQLSRIKERAERTAREARAPAPQAPHLPPQPDPHTKGQRP